jgi:hypothetical protein
MTFFSSMYELSTMLQTSFTKQNIHVYLRQIVPRGGSVMAIIRLHEDPGVVSFAQLYHHTLQLLDTHPRRRGRTVVLGPMSSNGKLTQEENMARIQRSIDILSDEGWLVLDLLSFQNTVDRLIRELCVSGYPFPVLEDFTIPLIRSRWFQVIHFQAGYQHSIGAVREHAVVVEERIPIRYIR